jgi:hypothetical protein
MAVHHIAAELRRRLGTRVRDWCAVLVALEEYGQGMVDSERVALERALLGFANRRDAVLDRAS